MTLDILPLYRFPVLTTGGGSSRVSQKMAAINIITPVSEKPTIHLILRLRLFSEICDITIPAFMPSWFVCFSAYLLIFSKSAFMFMIYVLLLYKLNFQAFANMLFYDQV